jgi:hypothetical protein
MRSVEFVDHFNTFTTPDRRPNDAIVLWLLFGIPLDSQLGMAAELDVGLEPGLLQGGV